MRLSVVFELLLVFLFLAFAAARVIDKKNAVTKTQVSKKLRQSGPNRYCSCTTNMCNCCREFSLPVLPMKGPGCASIMYLKGDNMMITMSFGDRVLSNTTITGPTPKPVCMSLPGGVTQFCGRIYGMSRTDKNFKACLGLEVRALDEVEAALRVSCFKFSPKGVNLEPAPPIPTDEKPDDEDEDDEDDYDLDDDEDDDFIGLGDDLDDDDDDDEDDDDDDDVDGNVASNNKNKKNNVNKVESDSADYSGFSVLGEDFFGSFFSDGDDGPKTKKKKNPVKKTAKPESLITNLSTTTRGPVVKLSRPTIRPVKVTIRPLNKVSIKIPRPFKTKITSSSTTVPPVEGEHSHIKPSAQVSVRPASSSAAYTTKTPLFENTVLSDKKQMTKKPVATPTKVSEAEFTTQSAQEATVMNGISSTTQEVHEQSETEKTSYVKITQPTYDVRLPDLDVEKIEAVAAIAQQGVTSSVIQTSSFADTKVDKFTYPTEIVTEEIKTEMHKPAAANIETDKANAPAIETNDDKNEDDDDDDDDDEEEEEDDDDLLDGIIGEGTYSNDDEENSQNEDGNSQENEAAAEIPQNQIAQINDATSVDSVNKKPEKTKPPKEEEEEEEVDDDDEEDDDSGGVLSGIIGDDDDDDEDNADTEDEDGDANRDKVDKDEEEEEEEEEEDDDDDDILGAFVGDAGDSDEEKEDSGESVQSGNKEVEESEEDIISALSGNDEEEDDNAAEVEDDDDKPALKDQNESLQLAVDNHNINEHRDKDTDESNSSSSSKEDNSIEGLSKPTAKPSPSPPSHPPSSAPENALSPTPPHPMSPSPANQSSGIPTTKPSPSPPSHPPSSAPENALSPTPPHPMSPSPANQSSGMPPQTTPSLKDKPLSPNKPQEAQSSTPTPGNEGPSTKKPQEGQSTPPPPENQTSKEPQKTHSHSPPLHNYIVFSNKPASNFNAHTHTSASSNSQSLLLPNQQTSSYSSSSSNSQATLKSPTAIHAPNSKFGNTSTPHGEGPNETEKLPPLPLIAKIKAATLTNAPQVLKLRDLIRPYKTYVNNENDIHPISTSRTHRRMNLDRWAPL